jgi:hypothetical protein
VDYHDDPSIEKQPPLPPEYFNPAQFQHALAHDNIFVGIAAYHDRFCATTLHELFSKARNPHRVYVGLAEQEFPGYTSLPAKDCVVDYCAMAKSKLENPPVDFQCPFLDHISVLKLDARKSRGPCPARAHVENIRVQHHGNATFCLQIDSHSKVWNEWDYYLIREWYMAENEYAILTTYVPDVRLMNINLNSRNEVPVLCKTRSGKGGIPRNQQATSAIELLRPLLGCLWGGGFSFSKCHAWDAVPYDPFLVEVFDGEEFSMAARFWTHGYDMYSPSRNYIFHNYHDTQDIKWQATRHEFDAGYARLMDLLGYISDDEKTQLPEDLASLNQYGFGDKRSFGEYLGYCGFVRDQETRAIVHEHESCGRMAWYPWGNQSWTFVNKMPPALSIPLLVEVFEGEEISMAARNFEVGLDFGVLENSGSGAMAAPAAIPALDIQGCSVEAYAHFQAGAIAVVKRGNCTFAAKVRAAENVGAVGALIFDNEPAEMAPRGTLDIGVLSNIPAFVLTQEKGLEIVNFLNKGLSVELHLAAHTALEKDPPHEQRQYFKVTKEKTGTVRPLHEKVQLAGSAYQHLIRDMLKIESRESESRKRVQDRSLELGRADYHKNQIKPKRVKAMKPTQGERVEGVTRSVHGKEHDSSSSSNEGQRDTGLGTEAQTGNLHIGVKSTHRADFNVASQIELESCGKVPSSTQMQTGEGAAVVADGLTRPSIALCYVLCTVVLQVCLLRSMKGGSPNPSDPRA